MTSNGSQKCLESSIWRKFSGFFWQRHETDILSFVLPVSFINFRFGLSDVGLEQTRHSGSDRSVRPAEGSPRVRPRKPPGASRGRHRRRGPSPATAPVTEEEPHPARRGPLPPSSSSASPHSSTARSSRSAGVKRTGSL